MYVILFALLAVTSAAPSGSFFDDRSWGDDFGRNPYLTDDNLFDTRRFREDLYKELREIDAMVRDLRRQYPTVTSSAKIEGDEYKMRIHLPGYDEKDIAVKAREGLLMIQAVHINNDTNKRSFLELSTLPRFVNVAGTWSYSEGVLTVTFPLLDNVDRPTTAAPAQGDRSREEIETDQRGDDVGDVDQRGGDVGDVDQGGELETNEIARQDSAQAIVCHFIYLIFVTLSVRFSYRIKLRLN